jgi:hypothetical protein
MGRLILVVGVALAACGSSNTAQRPTTPTLPDIETETPEAALERAARFFERAGAAMDAAKGDCDKAAEGLLAAWEIDKEGMFGIGHLSRPGPEHDARVTKYAPRMAEGRKIDAMDANCRDNARWKEVGETIADHARTHMAARQGANAPEKVDGDELDAWAARLVVVLEGMADAIAQAGPDCDKAATAARVAWEKDKEAVRAVRMLVLAPPDQLEAMNDKYRKRMQVADAVIKDLDARCQASKTWKQLQADMQAVIEEPREP